MTKTKDKLFQNALITQIFVLKVDPRNEKLKVRKSYTIGVITEANEYHWFTFSYVNNILSGTFIHNITKIFYKLNITDETEIMINDLVSAQDAIYLFLHIIAEQQNCRLTLVNLDLVFKRITTFHPDLNRKKREVHRNFYNKLYKKMIWAGYCPWITVSSNIQCSNMTAAGYRIQKFLRLCLYYMCLKKYKRTLR